ncbi:MAG: GTPase ObgE [Candidatus Moraniibacteriota bacterium]|nr:MAG: GTPase ObgE [Candidatus Moranbacteria bacterium]
MIIDDVTIEVKAGHGGSGVVRWARAKFDQGPTGGNGGKGGDVILEGVSDLGALRPFRTKKNVKAGAGKDGEQNIRSGKDGEDIVVPVPVGTVAHDITHDKTYDIVDIGQRVVVARGGNGGFGNYHFRSSRNTSPERANEGKPGDKISLRLELKMIADVGFVGYPNVGKSSLLNELTSASSKVANYQFTTLEPHLGVYYDLILADIPGLIGGAAEGKGLGHKFLRHIERTENLFHFVAADSKDPVADYRAVRAELEAFNADLIKKNEWIVVSKIDEKTEEEVAQIVKDLQKENSQIVTLSILDEAMMEDVKNVLHTIQNTK